MNRFFRSLYMASAVMLHFNLLACFVSSRLDDVCELACVHSYTWHDGPYFSFAPRPINGLVFTWIFSMKFENKWHENNRSTARIFLPTGLAEIEEVIGVKWFAW